MRKADSLSSSQHCNSGLVKLIDKNALNFIDIIILNYFLMLHLLQAMPLLIACVSATVIAKLLGGHSLYAVLLQRTLLKEKHLETFVEIQARTGKANINVITKYKKNCIPLQEDAISLYSDRLNYQEYFRPMVPPTRI